MLKRGGKEFKLLINISKNMARYNRDQVLELLDEQEDEIDSGDEFDGYVDDTEMMQVMDANEGDDNDEVETNGEMMTENNDGIDSDGCFSSEGSLNQDFADGPACSLDMSNKTPDYFQLLMTDSILDHIVSQTNLYADQHFEANPDIQDFITGRKQYIIGKRLI